MDYEIKSYIRIWFWTTEILLNVFPHWRRYQFPFSRLDVFGKICGVALLLYVYTVSIVSPRSKLHRTVLCVKRKVLHVDFAFAAQHHRRKPHVHAGVRELNTSRKTVQVTTKVNGFIRARDERMRLIIHTEDISLQLYFVSEPNVIDKPV